MNRQIITKKELMVLVNRSSVDLSVRHIAEKVLSGLRISVDDAITLYDKAELGLLGMLASEVAQAKNDQKVFFNRNFHIEPTNVCIHNCTFCSYRRDAGQEGSWEMSLDDIRANLQPYKTQKVTEVHITGGVHPQWNLAHYGQIIRTIKKELPHIHVKAFSAIEIDYIISKSKLTTREGIRRLKDFGLDSIPGGGAEISNPEIRDVICGSKSSWQRWLEIHEIAHSEGIPSNATMLYGHIESHKHRAEHMEALRCLQDRTKGFMCFIPLKFKASNNKLSYIGEVNALEDLRNYAVARIFFDNIQHIKAYWPMIGKETAKLSLGFGVNDLDGTINDTTQIFSMAGAQEQKPYMTVEEICFVIRQVGKVPVERDSLYNSIKEYQV